MSKNITFVAQTDHVWNVRQRPYPAAKGIPQWWKDIPAYADNFNKLVLDPAPNVTVKRCVPTLDVFGLGYLVPLWADLVVDQHERLPRIKWTTFESVAEVWSNAQVDNFQFSDDCSRVAFKYLHGWTIKTPPGWSCLFIHPIAYPNMPFKSITGIVDTDIFDGEINVPFSIKNGFEGIIEAGTPMFQVIPFKREKWESNFDIKGPNEHRFDLEKLLTKAGRAYHSITKHDKIYR